MEIRGARHEALAEVRTGDPKRPFGSDNVRRATAILQGMTDRIVAEVDRLQRLMEESVLDILVRSWRGPRCVGRT